MRAVTVQGGLLTRSALVIALYATLACNAATQRADVPVVPPVARIGIVVADSSRDSLHLLLLRRTRSALETSAGTDNFRILTGRDLDILESGSPNNWSAHDSREIAKLVRAILIVEVALIERRPRITARASAHYVGGGRSDTLLIQGADVDAVAEHLAKRVASELVPRARRRVVYVAQKPLPCTETDYPYFEFQVERQAAYIPGDSSHPRPRISGGAAQSPPHTGFLVQFVVDSTGIPEQGSFKVIRAPSDTAIVNARRAMRLWRFTPASHRCGAVRQLVQVELQP